MTLYEINEALSNFNIEDLIDEETGEILDKDGFEKLNEIQLAKEEKEINIALLIKNLRAEAEALNVEKNKLAKRERATNNKADFYERYLMWSLDGNKINDARVQVGYRKGNKLDTTLADYNKIPEIYKIVKTEVAKTLIKTAIKNGDITNDNLKEWGLKIDETPSMIIK